MLKKKLKKKKINFGSWITLSDPLIPDLLSTAKFDWLCVDLEHSALELNQTEKIISSILNNDELNIKSCKLRIKSFWPGSWPRTVDLEVIWYISLYNLDIKELDLGT